MAVDEAAPQAELAPVRLEEPDQEPDQELDRRLALEEAQDRAAAVRVEAPVPQRWARPTRPVSRAKRM